VNPTGGQIYQKAMSIHYDMEQREKYYTSSAEYEMDLMKIKKFTSDSGGCRQYACSLY
jgi:hypothetical protein